MMDGLTTLVTKYQRGRSCSKKAATVSYLLWNYLRTLRTRPRRRRCRQTFAITAAPPLHRRGWMRNKWERQKIKQMITSRNLQKDLWPKIISGKHYGGEKAGKHSYYGSDNIIREQKNRRRLCKMWEISALPMKYHLLQNIHLDQKNSLFYFII